LLVVAFLPFPTKLIAEGIHDRDDEHVLVTLYGLTLLSIRLLGFALDAYARREHLYSTEHADEELPEELQADRGTLVPVIIAYVIAIFVGLALPTLAVVLYLALAVFIVVPFGHIRDLLFNRSSTAARRSLG